MLFACVCICICSRARASQVQTALPLSLSRSPSRSVALLSRALRESLARLLLFRYFVGVDPLHRLSSPFLFPSGSSAPNSTREL